MSKYTPFKNIEYSDITSLSREFSQLVNNSFFSDVTFIIGPNETKIFGHKLILSSRCIYFKKLFESGMRECKEGLIYRPNDNVDVFLLVLKYIYTGTIVLNNENVLHVLALSDEFMIPTLKSFCAKYLL